jgi:hypothetical protein
VGCECPLPQGTCSIPQHLAGKCGMHLCL